MSTTWPYKIGEVQFLVKVRQNGLELLQDCMDAIDSIKLRGHPVSFVSIVGSQRTSNADAARSILQGLGPNTVELTPGLHSNETTEGIIMFNKRSRRPLYIENSQTYPLVLQIWAPYIDSDTYASLIHFCVLISSEVFYLIDPQEPNDQLVPWSGLLRGISDINGTGTNSRKHINILMFSSTEMETRYLSKLDISVHTWDALKSLTTLWPNTAMHSVNPRMAASQQQYVIPGRDAWARILNPNSVLNNSSSVKAISSNTGAVEALRAALEHCNFARTKSATNARDTKKAFFITKTALIANIQANHRHKLAEFTATLDKVLFLDDVVFSQEFQNFASNLASNAYPNYKDQVANETELGDIIIMSFQKDFDKFKQNYAAKTAKFHRFEDQVNLKFTKIEQDLKIAWRDGLLKEFLQSLPERYKFDLTALDFPSQDYNLIPQWQLRATKRHDHHEKCVRSAVSMIQRLEISLEESFSNHLSSPKTIPIPSKPKLVELKGAFKENKSLEDFVEAAVEEKFNFMLQLSKGQNKKIQEQLAETERALREETKRLFQQQVKGSPASTTAIALVKP